MRPISPAPSSPPQTKSYAILTSVVNIEYAKRQTWSCLGDASLQRTKVIITPTEVMGGADQFDKKHVPSADSARQAPKLLRMRVSDILDDSREAILEHNGQEYRLRITANGKLILTK